MYYKLQFRLRYDLIINVSREIYFSQGSSSSWWEMSEYLIRSITPFFFRRKISASIDNKQHRYEIFISSLFFPQLSCFFSFLHAPFLIFHLSHSLPLFLSSIVSLAFCTYSTCRKAKATFTLFIFSRRSISSLPFRSFLFFFSVYLKFSRPSNSWILNALRFLPLSHNRSR